MKKIIALLLSMMLFTVTSITAAPTDDIVDTAINNGSFSVLVQVLIAADLVDTLRGEGPFTVFAPTDETFTNLLAELNVAAEQLLAHPRLKEVLLFHVVPDEVKSGDLTEGLVAKTVLGEDVSFTLTGGVVVNDA